MVLDLKVASKWVLLESKVYWRLLFECVCADWSKIPDRTGS